MKILIILTVVCTLVAPCSPAFAQDSWWDKVKQEIKNTYEHYFPSKKPDSTVTVTESVVTGGVETITKKTYTKEEYERYQDQKSKERVESWRTEQEKEAKRLEDLRAKAKAEREEKAASRSPVDWDAYQAEVNQISRAFGEKMNVFNAEVESGCMEAWRRYGENSSAHEAARAKIFQKYDSSVAQAQKEFDAAMAQLDKKYGIDRTNQ